MQYLQYFFYKYLFFSYRRRQIEYLLFRYKKYFYGKVLNVGGGRKRSIFDDISNKNCQWTTVDIDKDKKPDVVANVEKLPFKNNYFDIIKATELFEHVEKPELGVRECWRVLKKGGILIISMPFIYRIHADPYDYQRFTKTKLLKIFNDLKLSSIITFDKQGNMFLVLADMLRGWVIRFPLLLRYVSYIIIFPILELIVFIDHFHFIDHNEYLNKFTSGYFIVLRKK